MKYKQWNRTHCDSEARAALERAGIPPLAALALCARGQDTPEKARAFLACGQELLHDPLLMLDMDKAAGRLRLALERGETAPEGLELSAVSELRVTEKGVEVKLVDRVRALETLWRLLGESGGVQQDELYRALTELGGGTEDWNGE